MSVAAAGSYVEVDVAPKHENAERTESAAFAKPVEQRERRFLIRQPKALQYFYRGQLHKADEKERVAGRFELFFDLLYVALVANLADNLLENPTGSGIGKFVLTYTPAWHAWADAKENANNYYNDDITQRLATLWIMALLVLYGNNANLVTDSIEALRLTVASYMVLRFTQAAYFAYYSIASPFHRPRNRLYAGLAVLGLCFGIPLMFESISIGAKAAIVAAWIVWEELGYAISFGPWLSRFLSLEIHPAVDITHESDRYSAFTIIVLGEFTYGILVGSPCAGGLNTAVLRAVWTLTMAFCFNSMYDFADGAIVSTHPLRRSVWTALAWLMIHLPMSAGLLVGGHTSAATVADSEMSQGRRWLWGGGLAIGMFTMYGVAKMHREENGSATKLLLPKNLRLAPRLVGTIVFALLPLIPEDRLSSTALLSCGAGLTSFVVLWETITALDACASIFERWDRNPGLHEYRVEGVTSSYLERRRKE